MKVWPVPNSYKKSIPRDGEAGSFWEDRGDRFNCGVDIFAPEGSEVVATESGYIIDKGIFTSPESNSYWDKTYYIILKTNQKVLVKFAKLAEVFVHTGDYVDAGQAIGSVSRVINIDAVSFQDPNFIQEMVEKEQTSMLHLELYKAPVTVVHPYESGNYFGERRPESLIDPAFYLNGIVKRMGRSRGRS
ncbi:M23 family metallopeptidase [Bacteroidota bacterium]